MYDLGGDLLMVASDRISTYDVVHPTPIPDKGKVLTGLSVLWFGLTRDIVPNHFVSATDGVPAEYRGRGAARAAAEDAAGRVHRARLHHGLGLEGLQGHGRGLGHRAAGRACRSPSSSRSRSTRRRRRPRKATTRRSTSTRRSSCSAPRSWPRRCATSRSRSTRRSPTHAPRARRDPRRHEVRVRARRRRRADAGRRGLHAGLLALLAGRLLRGRPGPAVVRQAVRARLGDRQRLGQEPARAGDPGRRSSRRRASAT